MFSSAYSQVSSSIFNGTQWLKQQWNKSYEQVRLILTDEPIVYRPEEYFPKDVRQILRKNQEFLQIIKTIKHGIKQKQYSNDWLMVFGKALEQVKKGELSLCSFVLGLEQLQNMESIPSILRDWIAFAKGENFKFVSHKQFRLSLYMGLWQVTQNKLKVEDWLKHLETYQAHLTKDTYSVIDKATTFAQSYLGLQSEYREITYPVPFFAYRELFNSIERHFDVKLPHNPNAISVKMKTVDCSDTLSSLVRDVCQWMQQHPKEVILGGLLANAWYQNQVKHQPLQWTSNIMVSLGVQQVLHTKGIQSFLPVAAATFIAEILPISAQSNPFFTVIEGSNTDEAYAITQTSDNSLAVAGYTASFGAGSNDVLLAKFDVNGTFLWAKTLGGINGDYARALVQTNDNSLVVAGYTVSFGAGSNDVLLAKFDVNGTFLWAKTLGGINDDYAFALIQTSDNGLAVAGLTNSFGAGSDDVLLAKFSVNGTLLWTKTLGGSGTDRAYALIQTSDNGLVVAGQTASFGAGSYDVLLAKFDVNGSFLWAKTLGGINGDYAYALTQTSDNGLVVAGITANFGAGGGDFLLAKFDVNGSFLWARTLGGNSNDEAWALIQTSDNGLAVAGLTNSFGVGNYDVLLAKFDVNGSFLWAKTLGGINDEETHALIQISDNGLVVAGYTASFGAGGYDAFLAKFDANGGLTLNCTNYIIPNVSDVSANISKSNISPTFNNWGPAVSIWNNASFSAVSPTVQKPCAAILTPTTSSPSNPTSAPTLAPTSTPINSQNSPFISVIRGNNTDVVQDIKQANDNSLVIAGSTTSFGAGNHDILLAKFDVNGNFLWGYALGGTNDDGASALKQTSDNGLVIAGYTYSSGAGNQDVLLAKFDMNGNFLWAETLGGGANDRAQALKQTSDNGLVIAGYTDSLGAGSYDVLLAKFDVNGTFLWARTIGGAADDRAQALQQTNDNGLVIAGYTYSFGTGNQNALLAKFDINGSLLWTKTLGGSTNNVYASALQQTSDNGLVITGATDSFGAGNYDVLLAKFDVNGTLLWAKTLGGINDDRAYALTETRDNGLVVAGYTTSFGAGNSDVLLAKFDSNGAFLWARTLGSNGDEEAYALQQTSDNNLVVVGDTTSFGTINYNGLLAKFDVNSGLALNCTSNITPNIIDISTSINKRSFNLTFNGWGPIVALWNNVSFSAISPTMLKPCVIVPSPKPTSIFQPTMVLNQIKTSSSSNSNVIPIAVGASIGGVALLGITGAMLYLYKKRRTLEEHDTNEANRPIENKQTENNVVELPPVRSEKSHTVVGNKYALINKISQDEAKVLKEQTGLEVTFQEGKKKIKFTLGQGQFGKLRLARNTVNQEFVGVKKIKGKEAIEESLQEAKIQRKLNGLSNVMPLLDSLEMKGSNDEPVLYQFMPLAGFGNGEFLIKALNACQDEKLKEQMLIQVMYGLLNGFKAMHAKNIYHMDFKPANFVVDQWGEVFIIDFGCAIETETQEIEGGNGDTRYFSPERLEYYRSNQKFSPSKADIWALGVTFLELAKGAYPFEASNFEQRKQQWNETYFTQKLEEVPELKNPALKNIWIVIKGLLHPNVEERLSIEQVLNLPIFSEAKLRFATKEEGKEQMSKLKEIAQNKVVVSAAVSKKDNVDYVAYKKTQPVYIQETQVTNDNVGSQYHLSPLTQNTRPQDIQILNTSQGKMMLHQYVNASKESTVNENEKAQNETSVDSQTKRYSNISKQN